MFAYIYAITTYKWCQNGFFFELVSENYNKFFISSLNSKITEAFLYTRRLQNQIEMFLYIVIDKKK